MTELRGMVQMLVGAVTAQQELLQQHFQPPKPQQTRELDSSREKTQQGETSEYRGVTEDPVIPMKSVAMVRYFLKLKLPTFKGQLLWNKMRLRGRNTFDSKRRQNFGLEGTSRQKKHKLEVKSRNFGNNLRGQVQVCPKCGRYHWGECWKDRAEVRNEIRCFHYNGVGYIKRNCPRLRTKIVTQRGGPVGGNVRSAGNARL
ncbi:Alanine--tRNA ligase like [Actinidia chinensis var. chinensis]|uniref:Alanine--tRNA ligase like n=1 Tax=Actinidia chinensis var. chinensis TaxID=1590841 RepID=A0A2R6QHI6_ACTCC|nr:Alanine--tRNA ligase like [Actinidia chinensis var. chinensis]PSS08088.1 Alanine--tRNA ligase like [Actinidia chinensis var. chinensis]